MIWLDRDCGFGYCIVLTVTSSDLGLSLLEDLGIFVLAYCNLPLGLEKCGLCLLIELCRGDKKTRPRIWRCGNAIVKKKRRSLSVSEGR